MADESGDLFQRDAAVGEQGHEAVAELPGRPLVGVDPLGILERLAESPPHVGGIEQLAHRRREDEPLLLPVVASGEPVPALVIGLLPENLHAPCRQSERSARLPGLHVRAPADRTPQRDMRKPRRVGVWLALQEHGSQVSARSSSVRAPVSSVTTMYACIEVPLAASRTASAWAQVSALEGRPVCPWGTEHNPTTLRFTLSRAMARLTERFRQEWTACNVRVLRIWALYHSRQSSSSPKPFHRPHSLARRRTEALPVPAVRFVHQKRAANVQLGRRHSIRDDVDVHENDSACSGGSQSRHSSVAEREEDGREGRITQGAWKGLAVVDLVLRPGTADDAAECGRICFEAFAGLAREHAFPPDVPSPEMGIALIESFLTHPGFYSVVAEFDGRIVGSNFLDERSPVVGVGPITIDPGMQNRGVGRRLMRDVMQRSAERRVPGIRLLQSGYHTRSFSLYASLGFAFRETLACMQGPAILRTVPGHTVREATDADLAACNEVCRRVHGVDRGGEVADALKQGSVRVVEDEGNVTGYATDLAFFAHAVAETTTGLQALIASAPTFGGPGILVPASNSLLLQWGLANGLKVVQLMSLMTIGLYNEPAGAYLPSILY